MAKAQTEDELNLRRKARRRLIGAVAFTLAVVVLLPMVLDSEPKPSGQNIDLRIPSPDKAGEFVPGNSVSGGEAAKPPAASAVVSTPVPLSNAVVTAPAQAPDVKKPAASPIQQTPTGKASPSQPSEPAKAVADGDAGAASAEAFVAQVGAYSNPGAAKQELNKLKKWGFKAYTEKSGDKIRVRVGPYPDRDKAEKAGKLLEKHGLHPVILSAK
ncbi:MAG: SPOR domain-containing protein [Gallionella sp.]